MKPGMQPDCGNRQDAIVTNLLPLMFLFTALTRMVRGFRCGTSISLPYSSIRWRMRYKVQALWFDSLPMRIAAVFSLGIFTHLFTRH